MIRFRIFGLRLVRPFDFHLITVLLQHPGKKSFHAGDAYEVFPIHDGLTAVLLSDGMGQDINAYHESRKVIRLMRECLESKNEPRNGDAYTSLYDVIKWA